MTEFNTAHNRRISMLGIADDDSNSKNAGGKRKKRSITFNEEEQVINPEDIDPSVGRFRNLVHTSLIIPTKVFDCLLFYCNRFYLIFVTFLLLVAEDQNERTDSQWLDW